MLQVFPQCRCVSVCESANRSSCCLSASRAEGSSALVHSQSQTVGSARAVGGMPSPTLQTKLVAQTLSGSDGEVRVLCEYDCTVIESSN